MLTYENGKKANLLGFIALIFATACSIVPNIMWAVYYSEAYSGYTLIKVAGVISIGAGLISLGGFALVSGGHFLKWFDKKNKQDIMVTIAIAVSLIGSIIMTVVINLLSRYGMYGASSVVGAILYEAGGAYAIFALLNRVISNLWLLALAFKFYKTNKISALVVGGSFAYSVIAIEIFSAIQYIGGLSGAITYVNAIIVTIVQIVAMVFAFIEEKADEE